MFLSSGPIMGWWVINMKYVNTPSHARGVIWPSMGSTLSLPLKLMEAVSNHELVPLQAQRRLISKHIVNISAFLAFLETIQMSMSLIWLIHDIVMIHLDLFCVGVEDGIRCQGDSTHNLWCTDTSKWAKYCFASYLILHFLCVKSVSLLCYHVTCTCLIHALSRHHSS